MSENETGKYLMSCSEKSKYPISCSETLTFPKPPPAVGYWDIGGIRSEGCTYVGMMVPVYSRPTDEQIKNTESLLGWKWRDA